MGKRNVETSPPVSTQAEGCGAEGDKYLIAAREVAAKCGPADIKALLALHSFNKITEFIKLIDDDEFTPQAEQD